MAKLYQNHVWHRFGLPSKVILDHGMQFTANFTKALCASLGIKQAMSMAYHPQTDGQTECLNQELCYGLPDYLCLCTFMHSLVLIYLAYSFRSSDTLCLLV